MVPELKLQAWVEAGLAAYKASPFLIEQIFYDVSQVGQPTLTGPGVLADTSKRWLPQEYVGATLRYGEVLFPVTGNTETELTLEGDPSLVTTSLERGYQIVPAAVAGLSELLQTQTFTVTTSFSQVPTQFPAFTIRLEKDVQAEAYLGESLESYTTLQGLTVDANITQVTGSYLLSIWTINRLECLWLYAFLQNLAVRSMQMFASWGFYDVSLQGSDLDPSMQYLAERAYTRHLLLTATRQEQAISTREVEKITALYWDILVRYQRFDLLFPQPLP